MENKELINQWKNGLRIKHIAHSMAFSYYNQADRILGLCSALLAAVVATTIFASISESQNKIILTLAGIISIVATISSSASAFLKYGELAARHNQAMASFGSLRRELEMNFTDKNTSTIDDKKMREFNDKWKELEKSSPAISQRIHDIAHGRVLKNNEEPITLKK